MKNLCFNDILNAEFKLYEENPVIKNPWNSPVVADPSVLTPAEAIDNKWHLFCHTFFGVYHYISDNGIEFKKQCRIVPRAMRPNINFIDGKYFLFYERTKTIIGNALSFLGAKWKSEIYCTESVDLKNWSKPYLVLGNTREFEVDEYGQALSNPFLLKINGKNRLYYSCGQTYIKDCGFCEPRYISFAESDCVASKYIARTEPIIKPDKKTEYLNLCSGCLKVYKLNDCFIGLQNGIFEKDGKSHSAIMLLKSNDGVNFEFVKPFLLPQRCGSNNWMAQYVYACCLTYHNDRLRLYFNARNTSNNIIGRECIGIFETVIKE